MAIRPLTVPPLGVVAAGAPTAVTGARESVRAGGGASSHIGWRCWRGYRGGGYGSCRSRCGRRAGQRRTISGGRRRDTRTDRGQGGDVDDCGENQEAEEADEPWGTFHGGPLFDQVVRMSS